ncbi:long-chain-fatty-acid--CoA ligase [Sphingomonas pruni]|uniref:long-chain-fatty-acid--CoA ligase n=1 Tax=Sphingomonas pruni TaxID=40683 RepID=UPI00082AD993|nr:long-chain-fatty-acid--CoA ligase [Sphingomonas pruni]
MTVTPSVIDDMLRATAADHPEAEALGERGAAIDFATLDARVHRIANGLLAEGKAGDRVAILGRNTDAQVELMFGILRARQVVLPVNWRLVPAEIAYILQHSGATRLFCDAAFLPAAELACAGHAIPITVLDHNFARWRDAQSNEPVARGGRADEVALQMYTSGTTGLPKGVMLTNANVVASVAIYSRPPLDLAPGDVIYAPAPMFHITGIGPVLRMAQSGARLVVSAAFAADEAVQVMARERVSYTTLAPAMIQACLAAPSFAGADLSALRVIAYGGAPIAETVLREATARIGCRFVQCYGLTETTGPITILSPDDHAPGRDLLLSCGRAAGDIAIRIVDVQGCDVPPGDTGEIIVGGAITMAGYAADPDATAATIRDGWLYTGDAGYLNADGYLFIRDRVKDMIVSGGENIYPVEVENALLEHGGVADAAVIGVPDDRWGEAVLALVVAAPGAGEDTQAILDFCRTRIAGYKCPKSIRFTDAVPRNAAGKILRREIREPFWKGRERLVG